MTPSRDMDKGAAQRGNYLSITFRADSMFITSEGVILH